MHFNRNSCIKRILLEILKWVCDSAPYWSWGTKWPRRELIFQASQQTRCQDCDSKKVLIWRCVRVRASVPACVYVCKNRSQITNIVEPIYVGMWCELLQLCLSFLAIYLPLILIITSTTKPKQKRPLTVPRTDLTDLANSKQSALSTKWQIIVVMWNHRKTFYSFSLPPQYEEWELAVKTASRWRRS